MGGRGPLLSRPPPSSVASRLRRPHVLLRRHTAAYIWDPCFAAAAAAVRRVRPASVFGSNVGKQPLLHPPGQCIPRTLMAIALRSRRILCSCWRREFPTGSFGKRSCNKGLSPPIPKSTGRTSRTLHTVRAVLCDCVRKQSARVSSGRSQALQSTDTDSSRTAHMHPLALHLRICPFGRAPPCHVALAASHHQQWCAA
jgi:hypothetical protein